MDIDDVLEIDVSSYRAMNRDSRVDLKEQILRFPKVDRRYQVRLV